ncbi:MAG: hypothetical protein V7739_22070 [Motiliproteus sp.]
MTDKSQSCLHYQPADKGRNFTATVNTVETSHDQWIGRGKLFIGVTLFILLLVACLHLLYWPNAVFQHFISPSAILLSAGCVFYLTMIQLQKKEKRDRIEHAVDVCEKAPDLNDVEAAMASLQKHIKRRYQQYLRTNPESAAIDNFEQQGEWEQSILLLEYFSREQPQQLAKLLDEFELKYPQLVAHIARVMAFFEKSAIGIELGHADDEVIWKRFNVAALKYWVRGYGYILKSWSRHSQSKHLLGAKELGYPYEHYEAWLRHHCEDEQLEEMLGRLHRIRLNMLKKLV